MDDKIEKIRVCFLEEWRPVEDENVKEGVYMVSNAGRIKNVTTGHILTPHNNNRNYPMLCLASSEPGKYSPKLVHRLVAKAFVENESPDEFTIVNHKDGNKQNAHASNLEWTTYTGNMIHAIENNLTTIVGETNHMAKITNDKAREICELIQEGGLKQVEILQKVGLEVNRNNICLISNIKRHIAWNHVSKDYEF